MERNQTNKIIAPDLLKQTIMKYNKNLNIYLGNLDQEWFTFSKLFFEKEIIKDANNKLDKIINLNKNIDLKEQKYNIQI